ncbi:MAG: hypothetical protein HQL87_03880 [Magnetococcales bacterium]|nr:hypothetical protein [Magnetococcales bacterium]
MWRNKSVIYPLFLLLLFVWCVVLGLGYMVDRAVLQDVRHTQMTEKAKWVADAMQKNLEETINHASLFKESWVDSLTWLPAPAADGEQTAKEGGSDTAQFQEKWEKMRQLFPLWQVDFLLILDQSSGKVLHQLPDAPAEEPPLSKELLEAAQQELQSNELWMTLDRMEGHLAVQVFTRLPNEATKGTTLVVFGQYLEKIVTQVEADHPNLTFLLAGDDDLLGSDPVARDPELLNPELIDQAIEENRPQYDDDTRRLWNLYYAPLQLLDQTVCLIIPIELKSALKIVNRSQKKLRQAFWFTLLGLALAGTGMIFWVVWPLRKLRAQARAVLVQCAEGTTAAREPVTGPANEIELSQRALSAAFHKLKADRY